MKIIAVIVLTYFIYSVFWGESSGCEEYASQYSCEYVKNKASYHVYFWFRPEDDDEEDNKYIGSTIGLSSCRNMAIAYAERMHIPWNARAYICVLRKDGKNMEKHRF